MTVFSLLGLFSVPNICCCSKTCHLFSQSRRMVEIRGDHWSFWRGEGLGCVFFLSLLKKNVIKSWYLCVLRSAICLGLQKSSFFYFFMNQWLYTQQGQVTSFLTKSVATKLSFVILSFNERDISSISALCIA